MVIIGGFIHFKRASDLTVSAKNKQLQADQDLVIHNYSNFVTMSDDYIGDLEGGLDASLKERETLASAVSTYLRDSNTLNSDQIAIPLYKKVYGPKTGQLIQIINENLVELEIDLFRAYEVTNKDQLKKFPSTQQLANLTSELKHGSPNFYDIETIYTSMKKEYGQKKIQQFLRSLNQNILTLDSEVNAVSKN